MVCEWGMSRELGPLSFGQKDEQIFLGREFAQHRDYSEETAERIDKEVTRLVSDAYRNAKKILEDNMDALHAIAQALLERETLVESDIDALIAGHVPPPDRGQTLTETRDAQAERQSEVQKETPGKLHPLPS
jgi:cell division protease FtsH